MDFEVNFAKAHTEYHRSLMDSVFRMAVKQFVVVELLSQCDEVCYSVIGSVAPDVNEKRFCGPNSLVRDLFNFELTLDLPSGLADFKGRLKYRDGVFVSPRGDTVYLWTRSRREQQTAFVESIESVCRDIHEGQASVLCPVCGTDLQIVNAPEIFDVRCPEGCFRYNFHREPKTGEFLHGHFFTGDLEQYIN